MFTIALRFIVKYRRAKGCPFETQAVRYRLFNSLCAATRLECFSWQNVV
jgi:hypothetical protein